MTFGWVTVLLSYIYLVLTRFYNTDKDFDDDNFKKAED